MQQHTAIGILTPDGTLKIEGTIPIAPGRVEVIIRSLSTQAKYKSIWDVIGQNHIERAKEDIDTQINALRKEWGSGT